MLYSDTDVFPPGMMLSIDWQVAMLTVVISKSSPMIDRKGLDMNVYPKNIIP